MRLPSRWRTTVAISIRLFATACCVACVAAAWTSSEAADEIPAAQNSLEQRLLREGVESLARSAMESGDAERGAVSFHQPSLACSRCHTTNGAGGRLGPDLARWEERPAPEHLVLSVLQPSQTIRQGFETAIVTTASGRTVTGLFVEQSPDRLLVRDSNTGEEIAIPALEIDEWHLGRESIMPQGTANGLGTRQQFLDLIRYLVDIADGGPARARELRPPSALEASFALPDYESRVDHAGMIRDWDQQSYRRGEAIYERFCANCHGTHTEPGSLPTSRRFAEEPLKNGTDPYSIYETLTRGFGMMAPQSWMVPQQKYDVIHYLREAYLSERSPSHVAAVDEAYLASLPAGDTRGPEPSQIEPWVVMDYGPTLINTYEIGRDGTNFAYKGIAVRLDGGPGGVSRGRQWAVFDHDTLRVAAVWSGDGFIDWQGIQFDGRHNTHPHTVGRVWLQNTGPGWANPQTGGFADVRLVGRDGRRYGPLPREWAHYQGLFHYGSRAIVSYMVGDTPVLEMPGLAQVAQEDAASFAAENPVVFTRTFNIGQRDRELVLQVAEHPDANVALNLFDAHTTTKHAPAVAVLGPESEGTSGANQLLAGVVPVNDRFQWRATEAGQLRLVIPAGSEPLRFTLWTTAAPPAVDVGAIAAAIQIDEPAADLARMTRGGPPRWPQRLTTQLDPGDDSGPFAVDVLTHPLHNPWLAQMRFTGLDFSPDGRSLFVCAWDGDVWKVALPERTVGGSLNRQNAGAEPPSQGQTLVWQRIASGLFQPLGLKVVDGRVHVTCRDQIVILHDLNGDGETDFYENFNNDHQVTDHFHEFATGLQVDDEGNFYYAKAARHALPAVVPHHGTLLRVSRDGRETDILATGFRAPNGVCLNGDGTFFLSDQEGHWIPKNRINWVRPGRFYGNMMGYHDVRDPTDEAMEQPVCWITNEFDRSPAEQLWVTGDAWRPLDGSLLSFSYGYGKVYVVPHETIAGGMQGGMCALPIEQFPTGIMRGRFHPADGQLYACGMIAWASSQPQPGGLYRIRYTGKPLYVPVALAAKRDGIELSFTGPLDPRAAADPANYSVKVWSLRRTENYGSEHIDEHPLQVTAARLSNGGRTVFLEIPDIEPTWCMEIRYSLTSREGTPVDGVIHNTIHHLP